MNDMSETCPDRLELRPGTAHPAIAVTNLRIERGGQVVVDKLAFTVPHGEVLAIRGPSGSGKTTLLGALCGLVVPASGSIRVLGAEVIGLSQRARTKRRLTTFGVVFQGDELLPELTLLENVSLPLRLSRRARQTAGYRDIILPLLQRLEIEDLADRFPHEVSGGQLQRAAVARAIVHRPEIVLADEPTESLDEQAASSAIQSLITMAREQQSTVLVVTHDAAVAAACDRQLHIAPSRTLRRETDLR